MIDENNNGDSPSESEKHIDYKAEYEKTQKELALKEDRLKKAEYTAEKYRKEADTLRDTPNEFDIDDEVVEKIVDKKLYGLEKRMLKTQAEAMASQLAENEEEKQKILHCYENSIIPTGDLKKDILNAKLLANSDRIVFEIEEAKRSALSKTNKSRSQNEPGIKPESEDKPPVLSDKDMRLIARMGMVWNGKDKQFEDKEKMFALRIVNGELKQFELKSAN